MKVKIIEDEVYPYYFIKFNLNHHCGFEADIAPKLIKEYNLAERNYMKVRRKLIKAIDNSI